MKNLPIELLHLNERAYNKLIENGIVTIDQLRKMTVDDLMSLRQVGPRIIEEIVNKYGQLSIRRMLN